MNSPNTTCIPRTASRYDSRGWLKYVMTKPGKLQPRCLSYRYYIYPPQATVYRILEYRLLLLFNELAVNLHVCSLQEIFEISKTNVGSRLIPFLISHSDEENKSETSPVKTPRKRTKDSEASETSPVKKPRNLKNETVRMFLSFLIIARVRNLGRQRSQAERENILRIGNIFVFSVCFLGEGTKCVCPCIASNFSVLSVCLLEGEGAATCIYPCSFLFLH